jgi:hypothetical protein
MNIIARFICFLFICINTVSCRADSHVLQASGPTLSGAGHKPAASFFSGKKDRLEEQSQALHPFLTVSTLSFMLKPGTAPLYTLHSPGYNQHKAISYCAGQAGGIVARLKAKMLFPVHYFW